MLRKPNVFVVTRFVSGSPLVLIRKRQLEPEGTMSMRRECDRLSEARHRSLESESEALMRQEQNRASVMAKKGVLGPESEVLLRKEQNRASMV